MLKYDYLNYFDVNLLYPKICFFEKQIINSKFFSFAKLNHAFWQMFFQDGAYWRSNFIKTHGIDFIEDFISLMPKLESFIGVSLTGPPNIVNLTNLNPYKTMHAINKIFENKNLFYGQLWKTYFLNYSISKFFKIIKLNENPIIVVGMKHLCNINDFLNFADFVFIEIDLKASFHRMEILNLLKSKIKKNSIIFYQAGEMLSAWFIHSLARECVYQIDMGRTLDVFSSGIYENSAIQTLPDIKDQLWMKNIDLGRFL